jgi:monoamine oxidase
MGRNSSSTSSSAPDQRRPDLARPGTGVVATDRGPLVTWESSRGQSGPRGLLVCYGLDETSGALAAPLPWSDAGTHSHVRNVAQATLAALELAWSGVTAEWNGLATLSVPFLDPNLNGSYSYYRVGQYQAFGGYEAARQGNVHFAGEHTSTEFRGFMEGRPPRVCGPGKRCLPTCGVRSGRRRRRA